MLNEIGGRGALRLAIVATHPIQHFVPFYRALARSEGIDVHVFFMSDFSVRGYFDPLMKAYIRWEMDLLSGYRYTFLPEAKAIPRSSPFLLNNPSIDAVLSDFRPDVVLAYGYNQVTQWRVLHWCRGRRIPLLMISDSELLHQRRWWRKAAKRAILPWLFRQYAGFLTTGDSNERYLHAYGVPRSKMFRCPFTIDEDLYVSARNDRASRRDRIRTEYGISPNAFLVLTVGKLTPGKRPLDILEAASEIAGDEGRDSSVVEFAVAGDGELMSRMKDRISEDQLPVRMLGFVNVNRLPDIYCSADVLLHLSEVDAHPLALSEAACIGLPMIVSDMVGAIGPSDIARPGENALVIPCGNIKSISAAIREMAANPALIGAMSQASREIFAETEMHHSVEGLRAAVHVATSRAAAN